MDEFQIIEIMGAFLGSLFNAFLFFFLINLFAKKRLSLKIKILLTFLFVMIIGFLLSLVIDDQFLIIDELILNGISAVIVYLYFLKKESKNNLLSK